MNGHLSREQISQWVAGEQGGPAAEHLRECAACRAEVEKLDQLLGHFRSSVRHWSEHQETVPVMRPVSTGMHHPARWVLVAAAILVLVTVPAYQTARERKRAAEQAEADAILMERVDRAVSRTVPRPMEPLIELISGGPGLAEGNDRRP